MTLSLHTKALLTVFLAQVIWGVAGPLVKIVLGDVPPFGLLFLRCLLTSLFLFPVYEFKLRFLEPKMDFESKRDIFIVGFMAVFVNIALYFIGQKLTTVIDAWVITSIGTPIVILISRFFFKEHLAKTVYLGAVLACLGTLVIVGTPILSFGSGNTLGNLLILASAIAATLPYFIIKRLVVKNFDPLALTFYFFLISLIFTTPFFLWEYWQNSAWLGNLSIPNIGVILFLTLGSSIAAYSLQNFGLKHLSASVAATIGYTSAVIAVGLSILFLHEEMTPFFVIGTIMVIIGLILAETRHKRKIEAPF